MNKIILSLLLVLPGLVFSRDTTSFNLIGGNVQFQASSIFDYSFNTYEIALGTIGGHKFKGHSFVGMGIQMNGYWTGGSSRNDKIRALMVAFSPCYRFYIPIKRSYIFPHAQIDIGTSNQKRRIYDFANDKEIVSRSAGTVFGIGFGFGSDIFLGRNFYLEPLLRIRALNTTLGNTSRFTELMIGLMITL